MKLTTQQVKQIIKEEMEGVLKEQEQLEEGAISSLVMGAMLALMGQNLDGPVDAPDGTNLDKQTVQAVLAAIEAAPNGEDALTFIIDQANNDLLPDRDRDGVDNMNFGYKGFNDAANDAVRDIQSSAKGKKDRTFKGKTGTDGMSKDSLEKLKQMKNLNKRINK